MEQRVRLAAGRARLEVVPGASHLFPEPGALERVAELAVAWFLAHLAGDSPPSRPPPRPSRSRPRRPIGRHG
jgi:putative phosphoribosyl transferase